MICLRTPPPPKKKKTKGNIGITVLVFWAFLKQIVDYKSSDAAA